MKASKIILDYLYEKGISKTHLANLLGESLPNLTKKLNKNDLSTDYIFRISTALKHDFFAELSKDYQSQRDTLEFESVLGQVAEGGVPYESITRDEEKKFKKLIEYYTENAKKNENDKAAMRKETAKLKTQQEETIKLLLELKKELENQQKAN